MGRGLYTAGLGICGIIDCLNFINLLNHIVKFKINYAELSIKTEFKDLTPDGIIAKFKEKKFILPKDGIIDVKLRTRTIQDQINDQIASIKAEKQKAKAICKPSNFVNWPVTINIKVSFKHPKNEAELVGILKDSKDEKVGVQGCGHSWTNIFVKEDGILLNMDEFRPSGYYGGRVKIIPEHDHLLGIAPGCSIMEKHNLLEQFYGKDDYVLPSNVIYSDVHYVGVASGGCHGTHFKEGSVPDKVEKIVLYDADGNRQEIPKEEMPVAAIGLGSIGIITEMEFRTVQERIVVIESHMWTMKEMMYKLKNRFEDWISFEVYWLPFGNVDPCKALFCLWSGNIGEYPRNDQYYCIIVREFRKKPGYDNHANENTSKDEYPTGQDPLKIPHFDFGYSLNVFLVWLRKYIVGTNPPDLVKCSEVVPLMQYIIQNLLACAVKELNAHGPIFTSVYNSIHYIPFVETLPLCPNDVELCFPCGEEGCPDDFTKIEKSYDKLEGTIRKWAKINKYPVNLIVEARIVGKSICPLSPAYSEVERSFFYLECLSFSDTPEWALFATDFFNCIKEIDETVKPHLAKQWTMIEGIYKHLKKDNVLGPGLKKLRELQLKYDAGGKFMSPDLEKLFTYP